MKKIVTLSLTALILASSFTAFAAGNTSSKIVEKGSYTPQQIQQEYNKAIENGDTAKQNDLEKMAREQIDKLKAEFNLQKGVEGDTISPRSVYDPLQEEYYEKYFNGSSWIDRDGVISLSMYPDAPLTWIGSAPARAWGSIVYKHSSDYRWQNTDIMEDQFYCHYWLAGSFKIPWNIEPHKTSINPVTCN